MQKIDGRPVYAATDLVAYLACEHLTQLERAALGGLVARPIRDDPELDVIRKRGFEHEARFLADLRAAGRTAVEIDPDGYEEDQGARLRAAAEATVAAMAGGADVIYQATFFDGTWRGHADFLLRVDDETRPSHWGGYHYEVADTKLARHVKAGAVLQICSYIDQLTRLQGVQPEWMHVALGGSARAVERLRVDDYMAYYRSAKARFLATMADAIPAAYPPAATYPDPVEHCDVCRWAAECATRRRADDHLSLVAGISGRQRQALLQRGIPTLEALGELALPIEPKLEGTSASALLRVREQARIQLQGRRDGVPRYELLLPGPGAPIDPERGLAILPPPSAGDLFLDLEGDPFALEDGIDYLFGVLEADETFHAFWSRDARGAFTLDGERAAFERLMDFIAARLARYPDAHIYHYAPYEPTALKRLMGRYGTREDEVDGLLRGGILVDLLRAVRQSLRASVESYSIKRMEPFYGFEREVALRDAGSSIVAFEQWLELGEGERPAADHLDRIEGYNRDDVVSNLRLRDWLEGRRDELARLTGLVVPRPGPRGELPERVSEEAIAAQALADRLAHPTLVPSDPAERTPDQHGQWLLAQLLGWHRREDKAAWWEFHRLMDLGTTELLDESDPIAGLIPVGPVGEATKGKETWRYRFPEQEFDVGRGTVYEPRRKALQPDAKPSAWACGDVVATNVAESTVDIRRAPDDPHPEAIVPLTIYQTRAHRERLFELGAWVAEHGIDADGPNRAARDLLMGRPPRAGQANGDPLRAPGETDLDAARRLALTLDRTVLPIQGPPGSGKTYGGARMIVTLLQAGRRVGITGMSHKVVGNLLSAVLAAAETDGIDARPVQHGDPTQVLPDPRVVRAKDAADAAARLADGRSNLAAGVSWLWVAGSMSGSVDVLFVDEAGQNSLANVVAIAAAADSIVLLGDPQQLDQPVQGTHPPGAERSALAHVLGSASTIPPDRGLFFETTWRLHPTLTAFTSEVFYDDRLESEAHLAAQRILGAPTGLTGTGPRLIEVATTGADNESPTEAAAVAALATRLIEARASWIDQDGVERPLTWAEVLIVAPYNAQVGAIARLLPPDARVGTVDKFQGQEAPLSLYSLTTSSPELAPRGLDFLYSRNRLNVATSRARCIAIVVGAPDLWRVRARTPAQMRLANAFCRFAELATAIPAIPPAGSDGGSIPTGGVQFLTLGLD